MAKRKITNKYLEYLIKDYFKDLYDREDEVGSMMKYRHRNYQEIRWYEQWAVKEIIDEIWKSDKNVIDTVEDFRKRMDDYACKNTKSSYIFSIAYDQATAVLDYLISIGYH